LLSANFGIRYDSGFPDVSSGKRKRAAVLSRINISGSEYIHKLGITEQAQNTCRE
jgi:hypothetical protein